MSLAAATLQSALRSDETGVVRIGPSRVTLESLVHAFDAGASAEEIVASYPSLELSDVYAAIAYVLRNRAEIDDYMERSATESASVHEKWEKQYPTAELRARLRERSAGS
jgi:uncharacterized protein (DUF433 family)